VLCLGYRASAIEDYFRRREFADDGWQIESSTPGSTRPSAGNRARQPDHRRGDGGELLRISLTDALELTIPDLPRKDPRRHPRVAARWLLR
jgi:hypothetical protein